MEVSIRVTSKETTSTIMKRTRQTEDERVLHEINNASDAIRKKYRLLQESVFLQDNLMASKLVNADMPGSPH